MLDLHDVPDNLIQGVTVQDALLQLAEEAAELSQAALKYARTLRDTNPTPVPILTAKDHLVEEMADTLVCTKLVIAQSSAGIQLDGLTTDRIKRFETYKFKRWDSRIKEAQR